MCDLRRVPACRLTDLLRCHTESALRHAIRREVLIRPFRGVVVGAEIPLTTAVRVRAAQLSIGDDLPGSHHSGADLLGFGVIDDDRVHLSGPECRDHVPQNGLWVHSSFRAPVVVTVQGVRITAPDRTALDLARSVSHADVLAVLDAALRTRRVTQESLERELLLHAGLRGVVGVRQALAWADGRAESPQESRLRWIILAAGLPPPELQVSVRTRDGLYRMDMAWPELRIGLEYDGEGHDGRPAMRRDRTRHNALDEQGWRLRYFTDVDVHVHPQRTADRLALLHGMRPKPLPLPRPRG